MSDSRLEVIEVLYEAEGIASQDTALDKFRKWMGLQPNHPDMEQLKRSISWYDDVIAHRVRLLKAEPDSNHLARQVLEKMATKKHSFVSDESRFSDTNRKYMVDYLAKYAAEEANTAIAEIDKVKKSAVETETDTYLDDESWGITIPTGFTSELPWHDPVMLAEKKKAIIQQTNGKSDFELSSYFHKNLKPWGDVVDAEIAARRASNPDLDNETFRLQNFELLEHKKFLTSTLAWISAKTSQTIVTDTSFPALELDAPAVVEEPVEDKPVVKTIPNGMDLKTLPVLKLEDELPALSAKPAAIKSTPVVEAVAVASATPSKLELQHLESMKSIIMGEINGRSGDSLVEYYNGKLKPATSMLQSDIDAAKARGVDNPEYLATRERQLSVMQKLSAVALTKITDELKSSRPVIAEPLPAQKVAAALTAFEESGEKLPMPETTTPAPQKKRWGWISDKWEQASNKTKAVVKAIAVAVGGGLALGGSLATAFTISANNAPEAPSAPVATPTAPIVVAAEPKPVEVTPPAPMVTAAPVPVAVEPVQAKPSKLATKNFSNVAENYKANPATINGIELKVTTSDTIERMCKSGIQSWVCPKTPENI
jgi:hypothetical protein